MVTVVPAGLLGAIGALPFLAACISRDCWVYRRAAETALGAEQVQADIADGKERRCRGRIAVLLVAALFAWQYYVYLFIVEQCGSRGCAGGGTAAYHALLLLQAAAYVRAVRTSNAAAPAPAGAGACGRCGGARGARGTRHCRVCRACTLALDHHCVLVNNCVGARSRKAFVLTCLYTVAVALWVVGRAAPRFWGLRHRGVWSAADCHVCLGLITAVFVGLGAGALLLVQALALMHDLTTLEVLNMVWDPDDRPPLAPSTAEALRNVERVMGPCSWRWLWPGRGPEALKQD